MAIDERPAASRRRIRALIRATRAQRGETITQMATALGWPSATLAAYESGAVVPPVGDLAALVSAYGGPDGQTVTAWSENAARPTLAERYRSALPPEFADFLECEEAAGSIRQFETNLIPGPLQTEDYARAIVRTYRADASDVTVEGCVSARMERSEWLREGHANAAMIMDESALRRRVGSETEHARQLEYLVEMSALPNVSIRVLSFGVGAYPAMRGSFEILEFADALESSVVFLERPERNAVLYDARSTSYYFDMFVQAEAIAVGIEQLLGDNPGR
jgi:transcriptional regulator with XRE-family HTH domain